MPALTPVDNTLGALFIGTICSSVVYGVTWLQVYSYYTSHCQKDRWPLKSLVALLMAVDTLNVAFVTYTTYLEGVTNFGDYKSDARVPWGLPATALSAILLEIFVQHFYAWRVYKLNGGSLYLPAAISSVSLAAFGVGTVFCVELFEHPGDPESHYKRFSITTMACKTLCDVLITIGMLSALSGKHSQLRRTNGVLNLMAIYAINCGTANLVLAILCLSVVRRHFPRPNRELTYSCSSSSSPTR
ncbi:hypothetical protein BC834DRAFT_944601 [Gloeopeniophorella convolvens]|nr:hypothetical protein BC834DRAFT_944601 [Gloeopeniophorella convolvens]